MWLTNERQLTNFLRTSQDLFKEQEAYTDNWYHGHYHTFLMSGWDNSKALNLFQKEKYASDKTKESVSFVAQPRAGLYEDIYSDLQTHNMREDKIRHDKDIVRHNKM